MSIFDQVEKMINEEGSRPSWADEILGELQEIKSLLKANRNQTPQMRKDKAYFDFVGNLRDKLRTTITKHGENYPEIYYHGQTLGINFKGLIYNKTSNQVLPSSEAFDIYQFLYENQEKLGKYLKI